MSRLRKRPGYQNLCPECLEPTMTLVDEGKVCSKCGVQIDKPQIGVDVSWGDRHTPAHNLHPDNGLGSQVDLKELKKRKMIQNQPRILSDKKNVRDRFVETCVSELWSLLKGFGYDEATTHEYAGMVRKLAKRYSRKMLGKEAVTDVLALFLLETSATSKDYRLAEMAKWINGLKGRPMPQLIPVKEPTKNG